jgi:hypothetical protein
MTDIEQLLAIEAIKQLKARYFYCMDMKRWDELGSIFSQDAVFDVRGALEVADSETQPRGAPVSGLKDIVAYIRNGLSPLTSVHHGHMPQIKVLGPDHAEGIWGLEDWLFTAQGNFHGHGHYHERYIRTAAGWRIESLLLTRLHIDSTLKLA